MIQQPTAAAHGSVVHVIYLDHVLFKDTNNDICGPMIRETVGWLDYEDSWCVRVVWERMANPLVEADKRVTGLVILKSAILHLKPVGQPTAAQVARSAGSNLEHSTIYRPDRNRPAKG